MENRNYILDRIKRKTVSIDEFNFDRLTAPPLYSMFTQTDLGDLHHIATSLKYSARLQDKYKFINEIMQRRGFEKFISGTNRVVYRPYFDNSFLCKVAFDAVAINDSPREFVNQRYLNPFVSKTFEVGGNGVICSCERVNPITSRDEFRSVASDIFTVLNDFILGEYVMDDIGSTRFMNWGIRKGFGPVILDYSFLYKLDGNKLFCSKPEPFSPTGTCDGIIDYDAGFNFLYCTKCGARYKASELAKAMENNSIIIKSEGDIKMKVKINGGNKNVDKMIVTGQYAGQAKAMPCKPIATGGRDTKLSNTKMKEEKKDESVLKVKTQIPVEEVKEAPEIKVNITVDDKAVDDNNITVSVSEAKVEELKVPETKVEEKKEVISPIEFDESLKMPEGQHSPLEDWMDDVQKFNSYLSKALKVLEGASDEDKEAMMESFKEAFAEAIDDAIEEKKDELMQEIINGDYELCLVGSGDIRVDDAYVDGEDNVVVIDIHSAIRKNGEIIAEADDQELGIQLGFVLEAVKDYISSDNEEKLSKETTKEYKDFKFFAANTINVKDIFQDMQPSKVIAIVDEDGNYMTIDGSIVAIDMLEDKSIDSISIVSKKWLDGKLAEMEENIVNDSLEEDQSVDVEVSVKTEVPTGVLPPTMSVNGVPVEE